MDIQELKSQIIVYLSSQYGMKIDFTEEEWNNIFRESIPEIAESCLDAVIRQMEPKSRAAMAEQVEKVIKQRISQQSRVN